MPKEENFHFFFFFSFLKISDIFHGPLHMDVQVLADQQELIYVRFVRTQEVMGGRDGWRVCQ